MVFLALGLLPLLLFMLVFFNWTSRNTLEVLNSYYKQVDYYLAENLDTLIESVDNTLEILYDYYDEDFEHLYDALESDSEIMKQNSVYGMLHSMIKQNSNISSVRFTDMNGVVYTAYANQGKSVISGKETENELEVEDVGEMRNLFIMPTVFEGDYTKNSEDYVFTVARNYMDVRNIRTARESILGTCYVDINVDRIGEFADLSGENETVYILDKNSGGIIYSPEKYYYSNTPTEVEYYIANVTADSGMFSNGDEMVFYDSIGDTDCVALLVVPDTIMNDRMFSNKMRAMLIVLILIVLLVALYIIMSKRMSDPIRELYEAMNKVRGGDLSVRANITSTDETRALSEGFNKMVEELSEYIDRVYVAELKEREAELNALKMQIKPHYLYNTLDIIRMTASENGDGETEELLLALSAQLHYLMGAKEETVPFKDEIKNIENYFVITRKRFRNKYKLALDIPDRLKGITVPKLILQPMVENAIKHGLRVREGVGNIAITAREENGVLIINVMDDGVGLDKERVDRLNEVLSAGPGYVDEEKYCGVGMRNVSDRIKLMYGEDYGYTVVSAKGMGTMIIFRLPVE